MGLGLGGFSLDWLFNLKLRAEPAFPYAFYRRHPFLSRIFKSKPKKYSTQKKASGDAGFRKIKMKDNGNKWFKK